MIFYHCFFFIWACHKCLKEIILWNLFWILEDWIDSEVMPTLVSLHEKFKFYTNLIKMEVRNWNQRKTRSSPSFAPRIFICCFVSTVRLLCTQFARKNVFLLRTLMLCFVWNYKINCKRRTIDSKPIKSANIFLLNFNYRGIYCDGYV